MAHLRNDLPVLLTADFGSSVRCLGKGTYSKVCLYRNLDIKKLQEHGVPILEEYAVKMSREKGLTFDTVSEISASYFLGSEKHGSRFISRPLAIVHDSLATDTNYGLVYAPADEDLEQAARRGSSAEPEESAAWVRELAEGLYTLHQGNILHLDLKPGNILLERGEVRISDLGSAWTRFCQHHPSGLYTTLFYRAPEILVQTPGYDEGADVWSFACTVAEIFLRERLFPDLPDDFPGTSTEYMFQQMQELLGSPNTRDLEVLATGRKWEEYRTGVIPGLRNRIATLPVPPEMVVLLEHTLRWNSQDRWNMYDVCTFLGLSVPPSVDCVARLESRRMDPVPMPEFYTPTYYQDTIVNIYTYLSKVGVPEAFFLAMYYLSHTPVTRVTVNGINNAAVFVSILASGVIGSQEKLLGHRGGVGTSIRQVLRGTSGNIAPATAYDFLLTEETEPERRDYGLRMLVLFYYLHLQDTLTALELCESIYTRTAEQEELFRELLPTVPKSIWKLLDLNQDETMALLSGSD